MSALHETAARSANDKSNKGNNPLNLTAPLNSRIDRAPSGFIPAARTNDFLIFVGVKGFSGLVAGQERQQSARSFGDFRFSD